MSAWDILINFVLPTLGGGTVILGTMGAFLYWLMQKSIDARFAKGLEDYRHTHSVALHNEKVRLDLYDRRFEIFSSIFPFYNAMISWTGTPEQKEAQRAFFQAWHKSGFLFSAESGIQDLLKSLNEAGVKVIGFKENSNSLKSDLPSSHEQFTSVMNMQTRVFEDGLTKLKAAIYPYLDFTKI